MTKVEELRGKIIDMAQGVSFWEIPYFLALLKNYAAAAEAQGFEKGKEEGAERVVASLAFVQHDDTSRGQYPVVEQIERIGSMLGALDEDTRLTVRQMLHNLTYVALADGRNQEKECIRRALDPLSPAPKEEK